MPKTLTFRRGLSSVLFWSIISAAFIGGTAQWRRQPKQALPFNFNFAGRWRFHFGDHCFAGSGGSHHPGIWQKPSGIVAAQYPAVLGSASAGGLFLLVPLVVPPIRRQPALAPFRAFHAGKPVPYEVLLLSIGGISIGLLWQGSTSNITRLLAIVVAIMGFAFIGTAILQHDYSLEQVALNTLNVSIPEGGSLLVIGLIGTTIVPTICFGIRHQPGTEPFANALGHQPGYPLGHHFHCYSDYRYASGGDFYLRGLSDAVEQKLAHTGILVAFSMFAAQMQLGSNRLFAAAMNCPRYPGSRWRRLEPKSRDFRLV